MRQKKTSSEEALEIKNVMTKVLNEIIRKNGKKPIDEAFLLGGVVAQFLLDYDDVQPDKKNTDSLTSEFMMGFTSFLRFRGVGVSTDRVFVNPGLTSSN